MNLLNLGRRRGAVGGRVLSRAAGQWFQTLEDRRLLSGFVADINFEPPAAPVPAGYLADAGLAYGDRGNGLTYGWNVPHKAQVIARHPKKPSDGTDNLQDTFAVMHPKGAGSQWQIAVPDGNYQISMTAGDPSQSSGQYAIDVDGAAFLTGKVKPRLGRWITASSDVTVAGGLLTLTVPRGRQAKIDFIDISQIVPAVTITPTPPITTTDAPFTGSAFGVGQPIPFAEYNLGGQGIAFNVATTTNPGNDSYRAPDPVGINAGGSTGNVIADTAAGEWLNYTVNVATAGDYTLSASVSNIAAGGSFHAMVAGTNVTGAMAVPNTGDATAFTTVTSAAFNIAAGTQTLSVYFDQAASNGTAGSFDTFELSPYVAPVTPPPVTASDMPFNSAPFTTSQQIPFAQYDDGGQNVAFDVSADTNPGNDNYRAPDPVGINTGGSTGNIVSNTTAGEWLNYTIDVATAGSYMLQASVANVQAGASFHAEVGGANLTGKIGVPGTSSWTTYATATSSSFAMSAGVQVFHVVLDAAAPNGAVANLDTFEIIPTPPVTTPPKTTGLGDLSWTQLANEPVPTIEGGSIAVNGKLYVFGGFYDIGDGEDGEENDGIWRGTSTCQVYTPATNTWNYIAPLPEPETHQEAVSDGTYIYLAGGNPYYPKTTFEDFATAKTWRYDIATNTWSSFVPLPQPRGAGSLALVGNELHFIGGMDFNREPQTTHWELDLTAANPQWTLDTPEPVSRNHVATFSLGNKIYVMGGRAVGTDEGLPSNSAYVFDTTTSTWSQLANLPKLWAVACYDVVDGELVIMGGSNDAADPIDSVIAYDPATNTWSTLNSFPTPKIGPNGGFVGNELIVSGGDNNNSPQASTYGAIVNV